MTHDPATPSARTATFDQELLSWLGDEPAANRGARDAGALSVGCNIELPREQRMND